jgi:hypothetical protein
MSTFSLSQAQGGEVDAEKTDARDGHSEGGLYGAKMGLSIWGNEKP